MSRYKTRYQDSPWYVKAYRWLRHKPLIPYYTTRVWWSQRKEPAYDEEGFPRLGWRLSWQISRGIISSDMNHVYTWDTWDTEDCKDE